MERLRGNEGLEAMLVYLFLAPETARQWLDKFRDESLMADKPIQGAFIPPRSAPLVALNGLDRQVVRTYVKEVRPGRQVTLYVDAQLVGEHLFFPRTNYIKLA